MIVATACLDRRFFEYAKARRGLARVGKQGLGTFELLCHGTCIRCDTAHALQEVESHALTGEQHAGVAAHRP